MPNQTSTRQALVQTAGQEEFFLPSRRNVFARHQLLLAGYLNISIPSGKFFGGVPRFLAELLAENEGWRLPAPPRAVATTILPGGCQRTTPLWGPHHPSRQLSRAMARQRLQAMRE
jgi:hypothetical protein